MLEVIAIYRPLVTLLAKPSVTTITSKPILCCVCATRQTYLLFNNGTVLQYSTAQGDLGNNKTQHRFSFVLIHTFIDIVPISSAHIINQMSDKSFNCFALFLCFGFKRLEVGTKPHDRSSSTDPTATALAEALARASPTHRAIVSRSL